jgi:hypothetical protein
MSCLLTGSQIQNAFYKQSRVYCNVHHVLYTHATYTYYSSREKSQFVFFISSSYIQVEKRSFFLLQVESIVNIGLFLNFLFSLKSITGFFRRSEALTSNKHIKFWACKLTHGDDKLSAQVQCTHFQNSVQTYGGCKSNASIALRR